MAWQPGKKTWDFLRPVALSQGVTYCYVGLDWGCAMFGKGAFALLIVVALVTASLADAEIDLTHGGIGYYDAEGSDRGSWDGEIYFTSQSRNGNIFDIGGNTYWLGWLEGTEVFVGTFDPQQMVIDFTVIETTFEWVGALYHASISLDGTSIYDGIWSTGGEFWDGEWSAEYVVPTPGDFNRDRIVDAEDLAVVRQFFGTGEGGDANNDGITDAADLALVRINFGQTTSPTPETSAISLVVIGLLVSRSYRRFAHR